MRIDSIESSGFPPFGDFRLEFPVSESRGQLGEVHLLTGVNGTGKTRLLCAIAAALGNGEPFWQRVAGDKGIIEILLRTTSNGNAGEVRLFRSKMTGLALGDWPSLAYNGTAYIGNEELDTLAAVSCPDGQKRLNFAKPPGYGKNLTQSIFNMKTQVALDALDKASAGHARETNRLWRTLNTIEEAVSYVTGRSFALKARSHPRVGLIVDWGEKVNGVPFSSLPDGLRSIIGWLVDAVILMDLFYPDDPDPLGRPLILLLDEIESHLHPAWQRKILPLAQRTFRNAQIFVATHSPFVISSINDGWIHKLRESEGEVIAETVPASPGDSYISVLEEVMGLDEWFDPETEELLKQFRAARDKALHGDADAIEETRMQGASLMERGTEVADIIQRELRQFERLLKQPVMS